MKNLLFVFFLINSICIYAESQFTFRGEIIDYNTQESIFDTSINFYSKGRRVESLLSDKNGHFEFVTTELIDTIEIRYVGSITMKIVEIDVHNEKMKDFYFRIPLFEDPFAFVSYDKKPAFSERRKLRRNARNILKGVRLDCKNNHKAQILYSEKQGGRGYQFIKFTDLINCELSCSEIGLQKK
jgi:hypothetical protein